MKEDALSIMEMVVSIINNNKLNLISNILKLGRKAKSISDGIKYAKLATFIKYAGPLSDDVEDEFYKKVLFGNENNSKDFFMGLMLRLDKLDEEKKIMFFAMLCDARVTSNIDPALFDKIYYTILSCTVYELEFIKNNMTKPIIEKENTITMFSMLQMGLVQKSFNETNKSNQFYFTEYARMVYNYALNYNRQSDKENVKLDEITIEEDTYTLKKVISLEEKKEPIQIEEITSYLDFPNNTFRLVFMIKKEGIKVELERLFFSFRSNSDYYSCQNLYLNSYRCTVMQNQYTVECSFEKAGLKSWANYGFVLYFKVNGEDTRYMKIFCYGNGYASQEIDKKVYEDEVKWWDGHFEKLKNSVQSDFYIRLATLIMDFKYS